MDVFEDLRDDAPPLPFRLRQFLAGPHENFHYLFGGDGAGALVDPTFHLDRLMAAAAEEGLRVEDAFFTHAHWDHIGGLPQVVEMGVRRVQVHAAAGQHPKVEEARQAGADVRLLQDGDTFRIGTVPVRALHTPGHQPESTCYLAGAAGGPQALFGGDTLFIGSCGRTDFPGGDTDAMFTSMRRLAELASPDVHVMPGHHYAPRPHRPLVDEVVENAALAVTDRAEFSALPFLRG